MLKKAGAIAIAGAMVMSLGTISAFAEGESTTADPIVIGEDITINPVLNEAGEKTGVLEVTVPYTVNASGVDQVTLLAEFGDSEAFTNKIDYTTTAYIDQKADDSKAFTFKINENRLIPEGTTKNVYLNVKIGGNGVAKAAEGHKEAYKYVEPEVPTTPITNAMISGAVDATITDAFNATGAKVVRLDVTDLVAAGKLDLTKQAVKIGNDYAYYTITSAGNYKVLYVGSIDENTAVTVENVADDEEARRVYYGDPSGDKVADLTDMARIAADYLNQLSFNTKEDISADVSADGVADLTDMAQIAARYLNQISAFNVESK